MKSTLLKPLFFALVLGTGGFPFVGTVAHSVAHSFEWHHGQHISEVEHRGHSHPEAELRDAPEGLLPGAVVKSAVKPFISYDVPQGGTAVPILLKPVLIEDLSPPGVSLFSLPPHFSHAPPATRL